MFLLSDGDAREDLDGITLVGPDDPADVVVIGGASDDFTYATINHIFRLLMNGAALVGMHRNMFWRTTDGLELDGGAYIAGLEEATGVHATICGKPAPTYFHAALEHARRAGDPRRDGRRRRGERRAGGASRSA